MKAPPVATIGDSVDSFGASTAIGIDYVAGVDTQSGTGAVFVYYVDSAGTFNRRPHIHPDLVQLLGWTGHCNEWRWQICLLVQAVMTKYTYMH